MPAIHQQIRQELTRLYGKATANSVRILYGGSVKPDNARALLGQPDVNGCLVGGASLKVEDFCIIIQAAS